MNKLQQLNWPLIVGMGALALLWPFMNFSGLMDTIGRPAGPLLVIALTTLAWLVAVLAAKVRQPIATLVFTGLLYGAFALIFSAVFAESGAGPFARPAVLPIAIPAILGFNALWGAITGLVAQHLQQRPAA